jgi:hypothetical protein
MNGMRSEMRREPCNNEIAVSHSSQIQTQMNVLDEIIQESVEKCNHLEERLELVLTHRDPEGVTDRNKEPMMVPMAMRLEMFNQKMNYLNSQLSSILRRIEL